MIALILNSGLGKRMGDLTNEHPKCMTEIANNETILSRQLKLLYECGITKVVMTTGLFDKILVEYCYSLNLPIQYHFINNPIYDQTNYIYSIYMAKEFLDEDIILMHGDLVFEISILQNIMKEYTSCMTVSSTIPLPPKDFKAVIDSGRISKIGIEFFDNAVAAQPLYKINKVDWKVWLEQIIIYCEKGQVQCYAENAFNEISDRCRIYPYEFLDKLCAEIDTPEDLAVIKNRLTCLDH